MAPRRKVSSMLGLAVLATVYERPMHPYEMASVMRAREKDRDMKIKWGSLYTVVANLEKHGFLEVAGSDRQGGRPERTVYRITDAGRDELTAWVRELVAEPEREQPKFEAALSVLGVLPPDEATRLLERRAAALQEQLREQRAELEEHRTQIPRLFLLESEYDLAMREAELAWLRALLDELTSGSLPGLDGWREYHRTGVLPDHLVEISKRGATDD